MENGKPRTKRGRAAMTFVHLYAENWRNFTRIDVGLRERVFIVGPNASGKSNLLDIFRFVRDICSVGGGFQEAVARRGGVSRIRCLAARRYPDVVLRVDAGSPESEHRWRYELSFKQDNRQRPLVVRELVLHDDRVVLSRPSAEDIADPERLTQTHLEQITANTEFRELAEFFRSVRYLHIVPQIIRDSEVYSSPADDPYGGVFIEQIASTPEKTRKAWLRRISEALAIAVPQLTELELVRDVRGTPHLRGKYAHWRSQGAWQSEADFSDGTLRLMGLLWATLEGAGVLLLEEPEIHLHPAVASAIPAMLHTAQRRTGRQVIVSTHSTDLLADDGIGLDEVLVLGPTDTGTNVQAAAQLEEVVALVRGGLTVGEALMPKTAPARAAQLSLFGRT
jgi:ABC-type cobalamin transport system ATPase subunit